MSQPLDLDRLKSLHTEAIETARTLTAIAVPAKEPGTEALFHFTDYFWMVGTLLEEYERVKSELDAMKAGWI
jgi:hypothetical protein